MATFEVYRYFWVKVTDRQARSAASRAEPELMRELEDEWKAATTAGQDTREIELMQALARQYLGPGVAQTIKIVVAHDKAPVRVEAMQDIEQSGAADGLQIAIASMPAGYRHEDAVSWLRGRVGVVWALGALACRLGHAVATNPSDATPLDDRD